MNSNGQELYRCVECGEMVEKNEQFIHNIKCQKNKNNNDKFVCQICLRWIKLKDKEEHLHCHELEQRDISEIINIANTTNRFEHHPSSNNNYSNKGIDDETIQNYPISKIKINNLSENKKKCLICLDEFKDGQKSIILPCIHIFHSDCIKKWMKKENFCPLCKNKII